MIAQYTKSGLNSRNVGAKMALKLWRFLLIFIIIAQLKTTTSDFACGRKYVTSGLIIGGTYSAKGQWPWLAALFYIPSRKFFCGASLISKKHTTTAAHCIQQKQSQSKLKADQVIVGVGKYDLSKQNEGGSAMRLVTKIEVHPEWNPRDLKYDADIAIVFLQSPVEYSEWVVPVCLPTARVNTPIDGGTIVS